MRTLRTTTGDATPTGTPPNPGVCLEPFVDSIADADAALASVDPDDGWGSFAFDFSQWPELGIRATARTRRSTWSSPARPRPSRPPAPTVHRGGFGLALVGRF